MSSKILTRATLGHVPVTGIPLASRVPASLTIPRPLGSAATLGLASTAGTRLASGAKCSVEGSRVTTNRSVAVSAISVYVGPLDTQHHAYTVAIYTDRHGRPGILVASSAYWLLYQSSTSYEGLNKFYKKPGAVLDRRVG